MKISDSRFKFLFNWFVLLISALLLFTPFNGSVLADSASYTVLINQENANNDVFTVLQNSQETYLAEAGGSLAASLDLNDFLNRYTGFHLLGTGADIRGYKPNEDITLPAGTYSEKGSASFVFAHYESDGRVSADAFGYVENGTVRTGYYADGNFIPTADPVVREDGSSVVLVFYSRDRYAISLRAHNDNDPANPVLSTGDREIPTLPEDPFIVKQGANLYERFTEDEAAGMILKYFSAHEPSYGDELQWTWWARWKGTNENGDPIYEIDPGNQFLAGRSRNMPIDPSHTGTVDLMEGSAWGLKDGDASVLEMWKREVRLYGINYTYYEDGQYHDSFDENGMLNENVKEEVIFGYHNTEAFYKEVWVNKNEGGYIVMPMETENPETGEREIIEPVMSKDEGILIHKDADNSKSQVFPVGRFASIWNENTSSLLITKSWLPYDNYSDSVTIKLYRYKDENYTVRDDGDQFPMTISLNKNNKWSVSNVNIPRHYIEGLNNQKPYYYQIEEVSSETKDGKSFKPVKVTYNTTRSSDNVEGLSKTSKINITNTQIFDINVEKKWDDQDNQDGKRPEEITVELVRGKSEDEISEPVGTLTLSDENNWKGTFKDLEAYYEDRNAPTSGSKYYYKIKELNLSAGYESEGFQIIEVKDLIKNSYVETVITNKKEPEKVDVTVTKDWDDDNDRDGLRGSAVTVEVLANGSSLSPAVTATLSDANHWTYTFSDLDKNSGGVEVLYTVEELWKDGDDYTMAQTSSKDSSGNTRIAVTNKHDIETIDVAIQKIWDDDDDRDGIRPNQVFVILYANGNIAKTAYVQDNGSWLAEFLKVLKNSDGNEIKYSADELYLPEMTSYKKTLLQEIRKDPYDKYWEITNSYVPEEISIDVTKIWDDDENRDGIRPNVVTFILSATANGEPVALYHDQPLNGRTLTLDTNNWTGSFTELPKKEQGVDIAYDVTEDTSWAANTGYTTHKEGNAADGFIFTNSYTPDTVKLTVNKTWEGDTPAVRPSVLTWLGYIQIDIEGADYSLEKLSGSGSEYTAEVNGNSVEIKVVGTDSAGWTAELTGLWKNHLVQGESRPYVYQIEENLIPDYYTPVFSSSTNEKTGDVAASITNKYNLLDISGEKKWDDQEHESERPNHIVIHVHGMDGSTEIRETKVVEASSDWKWTVTGLKKYSSNGAEIRYWVHEVDDYQNTYSVSDGPGPYDLTNTYNGGRDFSITVRKLWVDDDDRDVVRPTEITGHLKGTYKVDSETKIAYDKDFTVTAASGWSTTITVPRIVEDGGNEYTLNYSDYTITEDAIKKGDTVIYTLTKVDGADIDIEGGEVSGTVNTGTVIFTNTHEYDKVTLNINKYWDDKQNLFEARIDNTNPVDLISWLRVIAKQEGSSVAEYRIDHITKNGDKSDPSNNTYVYDALVHDHEVVVTIVTTEKYSNSATANPWTVTIEGLPANREGQPLTWEINEYPASGTGYAFTNYSSFTCTSDNTDEVPDAGGLEDENGDSETSSTVQKCFEATNFQNWTKGIIVKTWDDQNNKEGIRPNVMNFLNGLELYYTAEGESEAHFYYHGAFTQDPNDPTVYIPGAHPEVRLTVVVDDQEGTWTITVDKLPRKIDNKEVNWTVQESLDDYDSYSGVLDDIYENDGKWVIPQRSLTNVEKIDIKVSKVWIDDNNRDDKRKAVTLTLSNSADSETKEVTIPITDGWDYTFTGLKKYENGPDTALVKYYLSEVSIDGYEVSYDGAEKESEKYKAVQNENGEYIVVITNEHTPETVNITVKKTWNDQNDQDGKRAETTVYLRADGRIVVDDEGEVKATVSKDDDWTYTFSDLPKYKIGEIGAEIYYDISEDDVLDYSKSIELSESEENTWLITNTHEPEKITIPVKKVWIDGENQDGIRPETVTVQLRIDEEPVPGKTLELSSKGNWEGSFTDLDKYRDKEVIIYDVVELQFSNGKLTNNRETGYEVVISEDPDGGFTVTNTHTPEVISIQGTKVWVEDDAPAGTRPDYITLELLADGIPIDNTVGLRDNNYAWSFGELPKYRNGGAEIIYEYFEYPVSNYRTTYDYENNIVTNTYTPSEFSIPVTKEWEDNNNEDKLRPAYISLRLMADGTPTGKRLFLAPENEWSDSFTDLPVYNSEGKEIEYTIEEPTISGYTVDITGNKKDGFTVTNTHTTELVSYKGIKVWNDDDAPAGTRPDSITVRLYADGEEDTTREKTVTAADDWKWTWDDLPKYAEGKEIEYTMSEDTVDGYIKNVDKDKDSNTFTITNTYSPNEITIRVEKVWDDNHDQDGIRPKSVTINLLDGNGDVVKDYHLDDDDDWVIRFTVPRYDDEGNEITYSVEEVLADSLEKNVDGPGTYKFVDVTGNQDSGFIITNKHTPETLDITVTKVWDDTENAPESVSVHLHKGSLHEDEQELSAVNNWTYTWKDQPKYEDGKQIEWTIVEPEVDDYSSVVSGDADTGFTITNTYSPGNTSLTVRKVWADNEDQDGMRPVSVTVHLLANGEEVNSVALTGNNSWLHTFTELPEYDDEENRIEYSVTEDEVPEYDEPEYRSDTTGFSVVNAHTPEKMDIPVSKVWDDNNDAAGARPNSVTVRLLANGKEAAHATLDESVEWKHTFENMDKYQDGKMIVYSVTEDSVPNYNTDIEGDAEVEFIVTNTYADGKTSVAVTKVWDDDSDKDGKRPQEVIVKLLANGEEAAQELLSAANDWTHTFTDLDMMKDGEEIEYSVAEVNVMYYTTEIHGTPTRGFVITNSHTPEKTEVKGVKVWDDTGHEAERPETVIVRLHANEVEIQSQSVKADTDWSWNFAGLDKYADGKEIAYTVVEDAIDNYNAAITGNAADGFTVTNTYKEGVTSMSVSKHWSDVYDQDGKRPDSVNVTVIADYSDGQGYVPTSFTGRISADNGWEYIFNDLPLATSEGVRIKYKVAEASVKECTTVIEGDQTTGFIITNVHVPELINVEGYKTWQGDNEDEDGSRPDAIIIRLEAEGEILHEREVTEADNWEWKFEDLPKYKDGKEIDYTIDELPIDHYEQQESQDDYNITNKYTPGKRELPVEKVWEDEDDAAKARPDFVTVYLLKDGSRTGDTRVLNAANEWKSSFTGLDIYESDGTTRVVYTVEEDIDVVNAGVNPEMGSYTVDYVGTSDTGWELVNYYLPTLINIEGSKTWSGVPEIVTLPTEITVRLFAENEEGEFEEVAEKTVTEADNWAWSFEDFPAYDGQRKIEYKVEEDPVSGYDTSVDGYNITNRYLSSISLDVKVVWVDVDNVDKIRPGTVTVRLMRKGETEPVGSAVLNDGNACELNQKNACGSNCDTILKDAGDAALVNSWCYTFTNLSSHNPETGEPYEYYVVEVETDVITGVDGDNTYDYEVEGSQTDGFTITNTHTPKTVDIDVRKVWNGDEEQPDSVTVKLLVDGRESGQTLMLSESNSWSGSFTNLPKMDVNTHMVINYSVKEDPVPEGWTSSVSGNMDSGFMVTNRSGNTPEPPEPPHFFRIGGELPETGITSVAGFNRADMPASVNYLPTSMELQIPTLGVFSNIVTIEPVDGRYPVEWLGYEAGLLDGTAKPGEGISILAAHNTLNAEEYGPFALIMSMDEDDRFFVTAEDGSLIIYQVYANEKIGSHDYEALWSVASEYGNTLTLLTCEDERAEGGYSSRRIIAAQKVN